MTRGSIRRYLTVFSRITIEAPALSNPIVVAPARSSVVEFEIRRQGVRRFAKAFVVREPDQKICTESFHCPKVEENIVNYNLFISYI